MRNYPLSSRCAETTPTTVMRQQQLLTQSLLKSIHPLDMLEVWIAIFLLMATNYALSIFGLSL